MTDEMKRRVKEYLKVKFGLPSSVTINLIISPGGRVSGFVAVSDGIASLPQQIDDKDLVINENPENDLELQAISGYLKDYKPTFSPIKRK